MKKKINIALIVAVLALWGAVGYRFINNYFTEAPTGSASSGKVSPLTGIEVSRDTFALAPVGRDPFLNHRTGGKPKAILLPGPIRKSSRSAAPKPLPVKAEWPDIQYFGYIKSGKNVEVALVKINGELLRLRKGEKKKDVVIQNVYRDSVSVVFNKQKRIFPHQ